MTGPEPRIEDRRARPAVSGRARHLGVASVVVVIGGGMLALSASLPESTVPTSFAPQWWPTAVGAAVVVLGLALLLRRSEAEEDTSDITSTPRMLAVLACAVGGLIAWQILGFIVAMILMSAAILVLLGARRPLPVIVVPVVITGSLYLFFDLLLKVPL